MRDRAMTEIPGISPFTKRLADITAHLARLKQAAFLVFSPENRRYLSGFTAEDSSLTESSGALLICKKGRPLLLTDGRYETQAKEEAPDFQVMVYKKGLMQLLPEIVAAQGIKTLAYEPAYTTCELMNAMRKAMPHIGFVEFGGKVEAMRSIKALEELAAIESSVRAMERVFEEVYAWLKPGMTEKEIAARILSLLWQYADGPSFPPIVASGPNAALPHAQPTTRVLMKGEPVIVDMGAKLQGYCSDMTRTIFLGEPSPKMKEIYRVTRQAQLMAQAGIRSGMSAKKADGLARQVIEKAGYGRYFVHSLGHGVGLAVHESPSLSPKNLKHLKTGMVVTVEPGIYLPGEGGVRLENMVVVQGDGVRPLSQEKWFYDF
jgi:Xaa-Pro aminopeptidase